MRLSAIDLFAGAGGLSLGLARAGFDVRVAVDSWQLAVDTHTKNFQHPAIHEDISRLSSERLLEYADIEKGQLDLLAGGPPCQGFSLQRIGPDSDKRNQLVLDFAALVQGTKPRAFLMENVVGLLGHRGRELLVQFLGLVEDCGYDTLVQRVNAADYGVPQNRRRVLLLGWRREEAPLTLPTPEITQRITVMDAIRGLPPAAPPGTSLAADPLHVASKLSELNRRRIELIPPGGGFEDLPVELRVPCHRVGAAKIGHRGVYGRLKPDEPAATITARFDSFTRGRFGHPYEHRNLTLREGARLQSFPDDFFFLGNREEIAAQIGNAVPPRLAEVVARAIVDQLRKSPGSGAVGLLQSTTCPKPAACGADPCTSP
jgi:DNA (cytosine-5)-methyltransferase 1